MKEVRPARAAALLHGCARVLVCRIPGGTCLLAAKDLSAASAMVFQDKGEKKNFIAILALGALVVLHPTLSVHECTQDLFLIHGAQSKLSGRHAEKRIVK